MKPKLIAILAASLLFLILLAQNAHVVTINFLFWKVSVSQIILILFILLIGFAGGFITSELVRAKRE